MKELYVMPIKLVSSISEEYCNKHFPLRMERAAKFRFREDRLRCIGAGALLYGIAGIREEEISYNRFGKPMCAGKNFSLSHSGDYVILSLSDAYVGTDVEDMRRTYKDVSSRVCTEDELKWLGEALDEPESSLRFYILWTLKESIMKAEGKGLAMNPSAFSVLPIINKKSILIGEREYFGETITMNNHCISVCGNNESCSIIEVTNEMLCES